MEHRKVGVGVPAKLQGKYIQKYRQIKLSKGECLDCINLSEEGRSRCSDCLKRESIKRAKERKVNRMKCFDAYGRICYCCNINFDDRFLTLDHVNNDGAAHRKSISGYNGGGWGAIYKWAINNNFPPSLQPLCWNCNGAKMVNGGVCPHQQDLRLDSQALKMG